MRQTEIVFFQWRTKGSEELVRLKKQKKPTARKTVVKEEEKGKEGKK